MARWFDVWTRRLALLGMSGWLFQAGCARFYTQQLEAVFASEANPTLIGQSMVVDLLGPVVLGLINRF